MIRRQHVLVDIASGRTRPLPALDLPPFENSKLTSDGKFVIANAVEPMEDNTESIYSSLVAWDVATGARVELPRGSAGGVREMDRDRLTGAFLGAYDGVLDLLRANGSATSIDIGSRITRVLPTRAGIFVGTKAGHVALVRDGKVVAKAPSDGVPIADLAIDNELRTLAALGRDGHVRLWDVATLAPKATLLDFDDGEWAITVPSGEFTGTAEVGTRVGWVFEKPLEHFGFEQFASRLFRRDVVQSRLASNTPPPAGTPSVPRPPSLQLRRIPDHEVRGSSVTVEAMACSSSRVTAIRAFAEGRPVASQVVDAPGGTVSLEVPLLPGINRITVVAFDDRGFASNPETFDVNAISSGEKPDLWLVAIGVGAYPRLPAELQLEAAPNDARAVAKLFGGLAGRSFGKVHVTTLIDGETTASRVRDALAGLRAMKRADLAIVFFAGHGFKPTPTADMVLALSDVKLRPDGRGISEDSLATATLGWKDLTADLGHVRGRVLVLLDACHSGHVSQELVVPNDELASALARDQRAGVLVFAAAKGRQVSYEPAVARDLVLDVGMKRRVGLEAEPHGFFTGALLGAVADPNTDRNADGMLQASEIIDEVTARVNEVSGGRQTPWVARREVFGDFVLAPASSTALR